MQLLGFRCRGALRLANPCFEKHEVKSAATRRLAQATPLHSTRHLQQHPALLCIDSPSWAIAETRVQPEFLGCGHSVFLDHQESAALSATPNQRHGGVPFPFFRAAFVSGLNGHQVLGQGQMEMQKYGAERRRQSRKLHIGIDVQRVIRLLSDLREHVPRNETVLSLTMGLVTPSPYMRR